MARVTKEVRMKVVLAVGELAAIAAEKVRAIDGTVQLNAGVPFVRAIWTGAVGTKSRRFEGVEITFPGEDEPVVVQGSAGPTPAARAAARRRPSDE